MFKTCIYCNRNLGSNEVVENFPVGRRLAFDQEKGRLWVVCDNCRRWNLSPLEERWEAIEECERQFHDTSQRFSTDNIGLARLPEGLELVRIGRPQRREFAAWRYGREFIRRRIRQVIVTSTQVAVTVAAAAAGMDIIWFFIFGGKKKVVARVRDEQGKRLSVVQKDLSHLQLTSADAVDGWSLVVPYRPVEKSGLFSAYGKGKREAAALTGPTAIRAAGHILPKLNSWGGTDSQVRSAVERIEYARAPERLFAQASETRSSTVKKMSAEVRLALEMVAHEESERRALEGELALLEQTWREAEEIASIADRLLIPDSVEDWIRKQRRKLTGS
ncbi:MAG: hypothetical protein JSW46_02940 [Gemmatimonadota bacterium]|nr:MAG: hypothetical protein JSW46_02940 [Gemmatimonadota bacterium]